MSITEWIYSVLKKKTDRKQQDVIRLKWQIVDLQSRIEKKKTENDTHG